MEEAQKAMPWRFNLYEVAGFAMSLATVAVTITLWSMSTFQSKASAHEERRSQDVQAELVKESLEARISLLEAQVSQVRSGIEKIATDVSYIRGRLEQPKKSN